jgi:replicative DNA helicase
MEKMLEEAVLGGMLIHEGQWPPEVMSLEPEYFVDENRREVFQVIEKLLKSSTKFDEVVVTNELKQQGLGAYVCGLAANCPTSTNLDIWAKRLIDAGRKRVMKHKVRDVFANLTADSTADDIADGVRKAMSKVRQSSTSGLVHVKTPLKEAFKRIEMEIANPGTTAFVKTGLTDLDRILRLEKGQLTILAGRPSMGKSALAGNIATYASRDTVGKGVAIFSLEMDAVSLIIRMVSGESKTSINGKIDDTIWPKITHAFQKIHDLNLYIDDRPSRTTSDIRSEVQRLGGVKLVVVDYLQLARIDSRAERHDLRIGETAKDLKILAKDFNCHVVAVSQLNRNVEQRRPPIPCLADLRDSGNIEEHADNAVLLYRPGYYKSAEPQHLAEAIVAKQRNGRTGSVNLHWDGPTQTFRNLAK